MHEPMLADMDTGNVSTEAAGRNLHCTARNSWSQRIDTRQRWAGGTGRLIRWMSTGGQIAVVAASSWRMANHPHADQPAWVVALTHWVNALKDIKRRKTGEKQPTDGKCRTPSKIAYGTL